MEHILCTTAVSQALNDRDLATLASCGRDLCATHRGELLARGCRARGQRYRDFLSVQGPPRDLCEFRPQEHQPSLSSSPSIMFSAQSFDPREAALRGLLREGDALWCPGGRVGYSFWRWQPSVPHGHEDGPSRGTPYFCDESEEIAVWHCGMRLLVPPRTDILV